MTENGGEKPLAGQLALVTGASQGIGAAIAIELASRGAHVILTARNDRKLEAVEEQIHKAGGSATIAPMDLSEPDAVARLAHAVTTRWDALDILVINAAVFVPHTPVQDIDPKAFSKALTVNVLATQTLISAFHQMLKKAPAGKVVGITSTVGQSSRAYWAGYGVTKAAFDSLLQSYALENENTSAIRTVLVNPGGTRTAMRERVYPGEDPASVKPPEVVGEAIANMLGKPLDNGKIISLAN